MKTILCIPGLGGRENLFDKYKEALSNHRLISLDVIDWQKAQVEVDKLVETEPGQIILFCSCYGIQLALRTIKKNKAKVAALIVVEPYFGEFLFWRSIARPINKFILGIIKFAHYLGFGREKFRYVDYNMVEKKPLFVQPFYDIIHQGSKDYFEKIDDILTFELPNLIETKTLFIFSPLGFIRDPRKRARLKNVFINADMVEIGERTHNIMTLSYKVIAEAIVNWLKNNNL